MYIKEIFMKTLNFTQTRQNLASTFDSVVENSMPVVVTRQNKEPVVIISMKDYKSLLETIYLMQSERSIAQLEAGLGKKRELIEE